MQPRRPVKKKNIGLQGLKAALAYLAPELHQILQVL
jgi:hypothetical protein